MLRAVPGPVLTAAPQPWVEGRGDVPGLRDSAVMELTLLAREGDPGVRTDRGRSALRISVRLQFEIFYLQFIKKKIVFIATNRYFDKIIIYMYIL